MHKLTCEVLLEYVFNSVHQCIKLNVQYMFGEKLSVQREMSQKHYIYGCSYTKLPLYPEIAMLFQGHDLCCLCVKGVQGGAGTVPGAGVVGGAGAGTGVVPGAAGIPCPTTQYRAIL